MKPIILTREVVQRMSCGAMTVPDEAWDAILQDWLDFEETIFDLVDGHEIYNQVQFILHRCRNIIKQTRPEEIQ